MNLNKPSDKIARQGMTLIELMVVIAIMMVLMGIIVGIFSATQRSADEAKARAELGKLSLELENMRADPRVGRFPDDDEGLPALVSWFTNVRYVGAEWDLTQLNSDNEPIDPWGNPYVYSLGTGGMFFGLFSTGPSGPESTYDNISLRQN